MNDYIKQMRKRIGHEKFIHPAARIIVENEDHEFLVVGRKDIGDIGIPAGAFEEGETIAECIAREVLEETGLRLLDQEVVGIRTRPENETVSYPNGDVLQYFTVEFYSNMWEGEILVQDKAEIAYASFAPWETWKSLPGNEQSTFESLAYFREHGRIRVD